MAAKKKDKESNVGLDIVAQINAEFGEGTIVQMDAVPEQQYETFSTGSLGLDIALGIGGLPRGRIVEVYGPESSGKTTIALHCVADAMARGHRCAFIDAEHALDLRYAANLGVDVAKLAVSQPDCGEQALDVCERLVKSEKFAVIVVDSVAALTPKAELEGEMGDSHMGLHARLMSQAMRKLVAAVNISDTLLVFINQTRSKIGVVYGSPETTTGGNALKFYASIRLKVNRIGSVGKAQEDKGVTANKTRVKVVKNKCAPPFKEAEFDIEFGRGISMEGEIIDVAETMGLIQKAGSWYSVFGEQLAQGKENAKQCLSSNANLRNKLLIAIRGSLQE